MTPAQQARLTALGWAPALFQPAIRTGPNRASTYNLKLSTAAIIQTPEGKPEAFQRLYRHALAISKQAEKVAS